MPRSREPGAAQRGEAQAVAPDLALVKDEMDAEEYDMSQHGQELGLSALKHEYEIDIEEHDLLQHPRVRAALQSRPEVLEQASQPGSSIRPELSVVKVEAGAQELGSVQGPEPQSVQLDKCGLFAVVQESQTAQGASSHSVMVGGIRIKLEKDYLLDHIKKLSSAKVVLRDCGPELQQSGRYCQDCGGSYARASYFNDRDSAASTLLAKPTQSSKREKIFRCEKCEHRSVRKSDLKTHKIMPTGEKPFQCDQCEFKSAHSGHLKIHKRTHTGEKPFKCNQCDYRAVQSGHLKQHINTHTKNKPFQCDQCEFKSAHSGHLKIHMRTHTGEKPFKCNQCDYRAVQSGHLKQHINTHTKNKPFQCDQCEFKSAFNGGIKIHMRTHTGEKPFRCDQCDYRAAQRSTLKYHNIIHTRDKRFKCDQCEYRSNRKGNLKKHSIIHTEKKPFKCNQCDYRAAQSSHLKEHLEIHTEKKPFSWLFNLAKEVAKDQGFQYCWTDNGKIYVRKGIGTPRVEVKDEAQLYTLKNEEQK